MRSVSRCDDVDNCASNPCMNGGGCLDWRDTFTCTCKTGLTSDRCELNMDDCVWNSCQNGATCMDGIDSYTCQCNSKFNGMFCEMQIVDGGLTSWGSWGPCSVTCDSGQQMRARECSDPAPENGGSNCTGNDTEVQTCTMYDACVYECDVDPPDPPNGSMNCSWHGQGTRQCLPFCDDGYAFDSDLFLDNIICSPDTGYEWNIRNTQNSDVQIGTCTEIQLAEDDTMIYSGDYEDLTPEVSLRARTHLSTVIRSTVKAAINGLDCNQKGHCSMRSLEVTGMMTGIKDKSSRRNTDLIGFEVEISCVPRKDIWRTMYTYTIKAK